MTDRAKAMSAAVVTVNVVAGRKANHGPPAKANVFDAAKVRPVAVATVDAAVMRRAVIFGAGPGGLMAAEVLAEQTALVDADLAYTAGLVSEVGRLALVLSCGSFLPMIRTHCQLRRSTWKEAEKSVLGFDHAEVSGRLLTAERDEHVVTRLFIAT